LIILHPLLTSLTLVHNTFHALLICIAFIKEHVRIINQHFPPLTSSSAPASTYSRLSRHSLLTSSSAPASTYSRLSRYSLLTSSSAPASTYFRLSKHNRHFPPSPHPQPRLVLIPVFPNIVSPPHPEPRCFIPVFPNIIAIFRNFSIRREHVRPRDFNVVESNLGIVDSV
jgi:hypothetical protein